MVKKILGKKKNWAKKNFGSKKCLGQKKFWVKKNLGQKKFWVKKCFGSNIKIIMHKLEANYHPIYFDWRPFVYLFPAWLQPKNNNFFLNLIF